MLEGLTPPNLNKRSCKVGATLARLNEADRKILSEAVENSVQWPVSTLSKELSKLGLLISDSPLYKHRARTCVCFE